MITRKPIVSVNGGEFTPLFEGRPDHAKYSSGCREFENFRLLKYGGATRRNGLEYVASAKYADRDCRMLTFSFNTTDSYDIEAGDLYMRFHDAAGTVLVPTGSAWITGTAYDEADILTDSGNSYYVIGSYTSGASVAADVSNGDLALLGVTGDPVEIVSPYDDTEVFEVQTAPINDVTYFSHPSHPPYKLSRISDAYWTMEEAQWIFPALLDENVDESITIEPSGITAGTSISLTMAGASLFREAMIGGYFYLEHRTKGTSYIIDISGATPGTQVFSTPMRIKGDWTLTTSDRWNGTLVVQRSYDHKVTWIDVREFTRKGNANIDVTGTEQEKVYIRLVYTVNGDPYGTDVWAGDVPTDYVKAKATIEADEQYLGGVVKVTGYTSPTVLTADVVTTLEGSTATDYWAEGAWSPYQGFPQATGLFEGRLVFAGTNKKKSTVWLSKTDALSDFELGSNDTDAMAWTLSEISDQIIWVASKQKLLVGSAGGVSSLGATDPQEPLTPSNVFSRQETPIGSANLQALSIEDVVMFVQRYGRKVRELAFVYDKGISGGFKAPDMTLLADHITGDGITTYAYSQQPDSQVVATREDGELLILTYERDEDIVGWQRFVTQGEFLSVSATPGTSQDRITVSVKRTLGDGSEVRYIERFAEQDPRTIEIEDGIFVDSALSFDGGAAVNITGLTQAAPPVVTVDSHSFVDGYQVRIEGTGIAQIDGKVCTIRNQTATSFELYDETDTEARDLRNTTWAVTTVADTVPEVTVTTDLAHDLLVGDVVTLSGVSGSASSTLNDKDWIITSVPTSTTFTINLYPALLTWTASGGSVALKAPAGTYASTGTAQRCENTFGNLAHLEGLSVRALVDGATILDETVSGGTVTLDEFGNKVHIGLPYTSTLRPMPLVFADRSGSSMGKTLRIADATIKFYRSSGIKFGEDTSSKFDEIPFRATDFLPDAPVPLYSGDKRWPFRGTNNTRGDMVIFTDSPTPATILAIIPKVEISED